MIIYIIVFYLFFLLSVFHEHNFIKLNIKNLKIFKTFIILFLTFYIGLRDEVGGDWGTYKENYFDDKIGLSFYQFIDYYLFSKDLLFQLLNYISVLIYPSYYLVNLFSSFIFSIALVYFCFNLSRPFLGLLISSSYLITVVAMGYHRQALAIAFFMIGLVKLQNYKIFSYYFLILLSFLFHYTSIILVVFGFFSQKKIRIIFVIFIIIISITLAYFIIGVDIFSSLIRHYIKNQYSSSGALPRILMCLIPSLIYLLFYKYFKNLYKNNKMMVSFAFSSVFLFLILAVYNNSSAFVDRLAIYLIPFQILFYDKFMDVFENKKKSSLVIFYTIILAYLSVLIVWAFFGKHHLWWFPYKNIIFN